MEVETITTMEICDMLKWPRSRTKYPPTIVIFDCCRNDPQFAPIIPASPHQGATKALDSISGDCLRGHPNSHEFKNLCVINSTNTRNTASDGVKGGNGPFVKAFQKLITKSDIPAPNFISEITEELNIVEQTCIIHGQLSNDFYFGQKPAPAPLPPVVIAEVEPVLKKHKHSDSQVRCNLLILTCRIFIFVECTYQHVYCTFL
jgi:hypothetical protein